MFEEDDDKYFAMMKNTFDNILESKEKQQVKLHNQIKVIQNNKNDLQV